VIVRISKLTIHSAFFFFSPLFFSVRGDCKSSAVGGEGISGYES
jgi:hypothetical protein